METANLVVAMVLLGTGWLTIALLLRSSVDRESAAPEPRPDSEPERTILQNRPCHAFPTLAGPVNSTVEKRNAP